jgi:hypothetical protein
MKRWLLLLLIIAAALAFVVVPVLLIQPFKPQTERALAAGYAVKSWSPWATLALAAAGLFLVVSMWRGSRRWWTKAALAALFVPVAASVWLARVNVYEVMFNPLTGPSYESAEKAVYVGDADMVLAVSRGGERVAYPVRLLAYHHLAADAVGGVPLVATY